MRWRQHLPDSLGDVARALKWCRYSTIDDLAALVRLFLCKCNNYIYWIGLFLQCRRHLKSNRRVGYFENSETGLLDFDCMSKIPPQRFEASKLGTNAKIGAAANGDKEVERFNSAIEADRARTGAGTLAVGMFRQHRTAPTAAASQRRTPAFLCFEWASSLDEGIPQQDTGLLGCCLTPMHPGGQPPTALNFV